VIQEKKVGFAIGRNFTDAQERLAAERDRVAQMLLDAAPPSEMWAAPVAPARGTMRLQDSYSIQPGGTRKREDPHWVEASVLESMVAIARDRHVEREIEGPFVPPFTPGQIAVARDYRILVDWRNGSGVKCSSLEAGRAGGGGSGLFIDSFIDSGRWLTELQRRIGDGVALSVRRHMDRDNGRRNISVRRLVDLVVLQDKVISVVLQGHGWGRQTKHIKLCREAIQGALDRMMGYRDLGGAR